MTKSSPALFNQENANEFPMNYYHNPVSRTIITNKQTKHP